MPFVRSGFAAEYPNSRCCHQMGDALRHLSVRRGLARARAWLRSLATLCITSGPLRCGKRGSNFIHDFDFSAQLNRLNFSYTSYCK
jgi:hypothetical protein